MIASRVKRKYDSLKLKYSLINLYERVRLRKLPRYVPTKTKFLGKEIKIVDACTFIGGVAEIFIEKNYEFRTTTASPLIIDCGANIGLSCIFFRRLYPNCKIIAFEPDPNIFQVLKENINSFELSNINLHNQAIWVSDSTVNFSAEGAFSGRIAKQADGNIIQVRTARLKQLLNEKVDFLKIDIEGAEYEVIRDCADLLINVDNLFIEYHSHYKERQTLHEILAIIQEAGFRYHIKEAYTSPAPFIARPLMLNFDLQLNIFAFQNIG